MAQIPYSPVPSVAPSGAATPSVHLNVPEGAFGGGVAAATSELGQRVSQVGNELFGRAVALKQLDNEAEARDADTKYMMTAGQLHADYSALQGADAKAAFPKYQTDLAEARTKLRDSLSNPMAQKMYDASSLSTMGRSIFNGAGHAAEQFKQYTIGTAIAQMGVDAKTASDNPDDENLFRDKLHRTAENASHVAALKGAPAGSPQEKLTTLTATSNLWAERIIGKSKTGDPFEAGKYLDENRTKLTEQDYLRVNNIVRAESRAQGSNRIADEIYKPDAPLADLEAAASNKAKELAPQDPVLAQHAVAAVKQKYNQDKYATTRERATNEQTVLGAIHDGVKNEAELLADPKVAAAYYALPENSPLKKKPLNFQISGYNDQRDQQEQETNYTRLRGLAQNSPEDFLNTDVQSMNLNKTQRGQVLSLRDKVIKEAGGDLRVQHAMMDIRGARASELQAAQIYRRDPNNPADYDKFSGALQGALDDYLATNKKPASYDEVVNNIAPKLLRNITEPGRFFGTNETRAFKPSDSTPEFKKFSSAYTANFPDASAETTYKAYQRFQWKLLNTKSGADVGMSK
jgi:hypothetical protein